MNRTLSKLKLMEQGMSANEAEMLVQKTALMEEDGLSEEQANRVVRLWLRDNNAKWGIRA